MLQLLQAFGGPGRIALSFAPTYSMYPEYARDTVTEWVVGHRESDFSLDLDHARDLVKEQQPSVVLLPSPNNPTGTALPLEAVTLLCEAAAGNERADRRRRRGVRRVPAHRHPERARAAARAPQPGGHPHDEQGVRAAGLRLGYLAADPAICDAIRVVRLPYHLSAVTQAAALAALRHAPELLGKVDELRAERDATVDWLRGAGSAGRRLRRQLRVVRDLRGPSCCLAGAARPGRADPRDRPRRVAAGVDRHRGRDDGVQAGTDPGERQRAA